MYVMNFNIHYDRTENRRFIKDDCDYCENSTPYRKSMTQFYASIPDTLCNTLAMCKKKRKEWQSSVWYMGLISLWKLLHEFIEYLLFYQNYDGKIKIAGAKTQ
jgi:hypothetical protein